MKCVRCETRDPRDTAAGRSEWRKNECVGAFSPSHLSAHAATRVRGNSVVAIAGERVGATRGVGARAGALPPDAEKKRRRFCFRRSTHTSPTLFQKRGCGTKPDPLSQWFREKCLHELSREGEAQRERAPVPAAQQPGTTHTHREPLAPVVNTGQRCWWVGAWANRDRASQGRRRRVVFFYISSTKWGERGVGVAFGGRGRGDATAIAHHPNPHTFAFLCQLGVNHASTTLFQQEGWGRTTRERSSNVPSRHI